MMKVAICQSNYIPWKGYFDLIHDVDLFVFYDDVQYTKHDWRNRNKVKTPCGPQWLTVPVGTALDRQICEVTIRNGRWQSRHWKTILQLYRKAPFFESYRSFLERVYLGTQWDTLSGLNQFMIESIAKEFLGITTTFRRSSEFAVSGRKQDRLIGLLNAVGGSVYVSGPAAKAYLEPEWFRREGIDLVWKDYSGYPVYPQFHPPFEHAVTILDLLFHTGGRAPEYIWGWRAAGRPTVRAVG